MAVTYVANTYNGGTKLGTEPTGTAQGDLLTAHFFAGEHTAHTGPAGWTQIDQVDAASATVRMSTWWIVRGASAPSYQFGGPTDANSTVEIEARRGANTTTPIDGHNMTEIGNLGTADAPSITTGIANTV